MTHSTRLTPESLCPLCGQPCLRPVQTGRRIILPCRCYAKFTESEIAARYALEFLESSVFGQQLRLEAAA
jgi:uncharacterized cysteine cluster protein YcgN (CxxCxxCC family)